MEIRDRSVLITGAAYTSPDTAVGAFFQRVLPWPYERAMKRLDDYLVSVAAASE